MSLDDFRIEHVHNCLAILTVRVVVLQLHNLKMYCMIRASAPSVKMIIRVIVAPLFGRTSLQGADLWPARCHAADGSAGTRG